MKTTERAKSDKKSRNRTRDGTLGALRTPGARSQEPGARSGVPRAVLLGVVLALAPLAAYLASVLPYELNPYDEGVVVYGAEQVLEGKRPGADFYVPYSPGAFYAVAAAFRLFGARLLVERTLAAALVVLIAGLGYLLLVRRRGEPAVSTAEAVLAGITSLMAGLIIGSGWFSPVSGGALALFLWSGLATVRALLDGGARRALLAGMVIGLTMLWRLDFGLGALGAAGLTWLVLDPGKALVKLRGALLLGLGAAIVAIPFFLSLLAAGGQRAVNSLLLWPLTGTQAADLPWPPLVPGPPPPSPAGFTALQQIAHYTGGWPFYFPLFALALVAWRLTRWETVTARERAVGLWLLSAALPFFLYANGRTDTAHVLPLLTVSMLLACLALTGGLRDADQPMTQGATVGAGGQEPGARSQEPGAAWRLTGLVGFALSLCLLVWSPLDRLARIPPPGVLHLMELPGPRGAGIYPDLPFGSQYARMIRAIHEVVPPDGRIFSGTPRHDVFMTNDIMLYFLAERDPGTYYWCLDAGVTTTEPVQREMIRELEGTRPKAAVRWTIAQNAEANEGSRSTGVSLLDDYLNANYQPAPYQSPSSAARFYDLLVRK
jgi:hypothetical protein